MPASPIDPLAIHRYIDGELSPAEMAAFEARLMGDADATARVEAALTAREHLRGALRRVMDAPAPVGLRARVADALGQYASRPPIAPSFERTAPRSFWEGPRRANWLAVAASLLLVCGAVLFGMFGPRVAERTGRGGDTPVTEVAATLASESEYSNTHATCSAQDQPWRSPDEAERNLASLLRRPVTIPNLESAGFNFCCGGPCCVPGACDRGGQLLYCRPSEGGDGCRWLSIFVAPVETQYLAFDPFGRTGPLECGIHYSLMMPAGGEMHYWCDGHVTWFVRAAEGIDFDEVQELFPVG
ncbi:MAG: hypothetical protein U0575_06340 [Phycisphaerales bacterium]